MKKSKGRKKQIWLAFVGSLLAIILLAYPVLAQETPEEKLNEAKAELRKLSKSIQITFLDNKGIG